MDALLDQVRVFASTADEATRRQIPIALRDLATSLKAPHDTLARVICQPHELMVAMIAVDLGLFKLLAARGTPVTLEDMAAETGADELLLGRILRFLISFRFITEVAEDTYQASEVTRTFARPGYDDSIWFHFYFFNQLIQVTPQFLKDTGYKNPGDPLHCPLQKAMNTELLPFLWVQQNPEYLKHSTRCIAAQSESRGDWTSVIDLNADCKTRIQSRDTNEQLPLFVDVGGGLGSQCVRFLEVAGDLPGRVIVEDLETTLAHSVEHPRMEKLAHDFFHPQPLKGTKYFFLRWIIHDYPDEQALVLLRHIKDAMGDDSVLLINDVVLPNTKTPYQAAQLDMAMMVSLGALERTERQWVRLLDAAGLIIRKLTTYDVLMRDSLIEVVRS